MHPSIQVPEGIPLLLAREAKFVILHCNDGMLYHWRQESRTVTLSLFLYASQLHLSFLVSSLSSLFFDISKPTKRDWLYHPTISLADFLITS